VKKKPKKMSGRWLQYWHGLGRDEDPMSVREIETAQMRGLPIRPGVPLECREYVYASTSREVAAAFSVLGGGRAVCEVNPGSLAVELDTDFPTLGVRFHGPVKATSVQVIDAAELPSARQVIKTLAVDYLWEEGNRQYSEDGYLRTPPKSRARGYVDEDFRWLGAWYPFHFLYPNDDGTEVAIDENERRYVMFPPDHPGLAGRRRVPLGSLDNWRRPGVYPDGKDLRRRALRRSGPDAVVMPWQW
jgi:hypothetical protein